MRYQGNLRRDYIRDLLVDIRQCRGERVDRNGGDLLAYADKCAAEVRALWPTRHSRIVGRYGVPSASIGADVAADIRRVLFNA